MELIYSIVYYANTPLVSAGFVLFVFLLTPNLGASARAIVASFAASLINVGPGLLYNLTEDPGSDAHPVFYFALFWTPSFLFARLVSWLLSRKLAPSDAEPFE